MCVSTHLWEHVSKDKFQDSVLSFYHMAPRNGIQVIRLATQSLYALNHLYGHVWGFVVVVRLVGEWFFLSVAYLSTFLCLQVFA